MWHGAGSGWLRSARRPVWFVIMAALALPAPAAADDIVIEWNRVMLTALEGQNPFAQGRIAAIAQLAVFDAVNAITGDYAPYLGTFEAPADASAEAAAAVAAHRVLRHYLPARADLLDAALAGTLAAIPPGPSRDAGAALGSTVADALIASRADDGAAPPAFHVPSSSAPGVWQLTPGCPAAGGVFRHWGQVRPFVLESGQQFRSAPPPPLPSMRYARDLKEVHVAGDVNSGLRPPDRADVAQFYAVVLAVHAWNTVAQQIAQASGTSLAENARVLALLNVAISDALVTVMETKYHYALWRPITAIQAADDDRNRATAGDDSFAPFVATPCFPSYPSAHASASYAGREVLERVFGEGPYDLSLTTPALPGLLLQYSMLEQIATDIDDARIYGGIHFRFDQEAGALQGRRIGRFVVQRALRDQPR